MRKEVGNFWKGKVKNDVLYRDLNSPHRVASRATGCFPHSPDLSILEESRPPTQLRVKVLPSRYLNQWNFITCAHGMFAQSQRDYAWPTLKYQSLNWSPTYLAWLKHEEQTTNASNSLLVMPSRTVVFKSMTAWRAGVRFYIPQHLNKYVKKVCYINGRIIQLTKGRENRKIRLIQVHVPHSCYDDKAHETFRDNVENPLQGWYAYDILFDNFNTAIRQA